MKPISLVQSKDRSWSLCFGVLLSSAAFLVSGCTAEVDIEEQDPLGESSAELTTVGSQILQSEGPAMASGRFNPDSYDDLATTDTVSLKLRFGGPNGVGSPTEISLSSLGVNSAGEVSTTYHTLATGDFDGNGVDDVAVAVADESWSEHEKAGAVHVMFLKPDGSELFHDIFAVGDSFEWCGYSLAAGDFNGDGFKDLAIGCPGRYHQTTGQYGFVAYNRGSVIVFHGGASGLHYAQEWMVQNYKDDNDVFGFALAAGDFNSNGDFYRGPPIDDLAIGSPYEDSSKIDGGAVRVLYGSTAGGLTATGSQLWYGAAWEGLAYTPQTDGHFGFSLATGKVNTDPYDDIVIGIPGLIVNFHSNAGGVLVMRGKATGLTSSSNQLITQDTVNVAGSAASGDQCGSSVAVGDTNGDGAGDIAFGCPYEELSQSEFNLNFGPLITSTPGQIWYQSNRLGDGIELCMGDFNGDAKQDVAAATSISPTGEVIIRPGL